ncbi:hypothetical protein [Spartinivicinus poritis]|uniref:Uncharacterized protein n=1 Tax=Spartinivicinus poritis TaxID=2994640 RepID=A0ABT5UC53_9GAMM|nr:hypothetical protein [Spartinivicinus sp. A2-2]MDE1462689.1 hypothetical protein [Spartinivicinus sp. A2-2]
MIKSISFPDIDTSYWKTEDKEWVVTRKQEWKNIEHMFQGSASKSKKAMGVIKQYFLKGKMPDFKAFRDWSPYDGHLDLFCFIWLHPSWDEMVLQALRDAYIAHEYVKENDVRTGFGLMVEYCFVWPCCKYTEDESISILRTGHNEVIFKVLMGGLLQMEYSVGGIIRQLPKSELYHLSLMTDWLCLEKLYEYNKDMVFQYDLTLEWWYQSCPTNEDFFEKDKIYNKDGTLYLYRYLYRIHHFDTKKEGNTCRSHFVHKMRRILDEREFIPEFKQMWLDIKSNKINVEEPWNIHWKPKPKKPRLP